MPDNPNLSDAGARLADAINEQRLWQRHIAIAQWGATGRGGVDRQALTQEDTAAKQMMLGWAKAAGFTTGADAIGNLFVRRAGREPDAAPVASGSHLDTQPTGGNFDGVYGVLAAFEVLEAANDIGLVTARPMEAIAWMNEEGARFQPGTMGSSVFAGALTLDEALAAEDSAGARVADALAAAREALTIDAEVALQAPMAGYLEAHIEQGPVLEAMGKTVGVVSGIQGLRWFEIVVTGEEGHAGTTPHRGRRDAVASAVRMVAALERLMEDETDTVRFTVGRFDVAPNSPNTIPGRVLFTVDFRHPDGAALTNLGDQIDGVCQANKGTCDVTVRQTIGAPPTDFDIGIRARIHAAAVRQGVACMEMVSGATHDAKYMVGRCPTGMVFVPCAGGLSHNEAEAATPGDLAAGARVLAEVMAQLADA